VFSEFGNNHLGKQADSGDAATRRTRRRRRSGHPVAAARTGVFGQDVHLELEVGRDKVEHPCFVLADACFGLAALRTNLVGLGDVVLDAQLRQSLVIRLARTA
jgi:hypothetical protein